MKFTNHIGKKVKCDCCDDNPKEAVCVLKFNKFYDSVYMCTACVDDFRSSVKWLFS